ncbi:MAG: Gfo/Idh/MocA family oxidoreductase [Chloroflexota bacterium]|nr:MAG: Gfo/Idh/MocA family oxidoreductase [Chloroflexota bacterium]
MSDDKIKVGLIGLGSIAQRGILPHTFQDDARTKIDAVAVCDAVPGRAEATAEKWVWRDAYVDYDEMLARADIDAVLIATPIPLHYRQIMAALEAGKHVYTQKTMTTRLEEANDIVALAARKGLTVCASPGEMLRAPYPQMKEAIQKGLIGRPYWSLAGMQSGGHEYEAFRKEGDVLSNVDPTWYYKKGGGPVYDMTVYCLHEMTGILGPAKRVQAMSGIGLPVRTWKGKDIEVEMDDNTHITIDFGDALFGFAYGANCRGGPIPRIAIFGSEGCVYADRPGGGGGPRAVITGPKVPGGEMDLDLPGMPYRVGPHLEIGEAHGYADIMHFVDCLRTGTKPIPSAEHARHVVEIIDRAYQSARDGRAYDLTTTF